MSRPASRLLRGLGACAALLAAACGTWLDPATQGDGAPSAASEAPLVLPPPDRTVARPWLVAFVSVGGLTAAAWEGPEPAMPFLARLAKGGASSPRVQPVAPASHSPAQASLVTGRSPALHGIVSERRLGDAGVAAAGFTEASLLAGPTLWSAAADARRGVAALGWPTTVGASIAVLLPDVGIAPGAASWPAVLAGLATPQVLDSVRRAGGDAPQTAVPGAARDRVLADVACDLLGSASPPNLLLLHLAQVRLPVARDGPDAPAVRRSLAEVDADLERLVTCLFRLGRLEGASFVVTGDHGSLPVHTALAPNALLAAEGLLQREKDGTLREWRAIARSNGGSAFVYARSTDDALRARRALEREAGRSGQFRVVSAEELLAQQADPEAWFGLEAQPGFHFTDGDTGALAAPSALGGSGGYLPGRPEMAPGFVAWGRGVRAGVQIPWMRQVDVAPTVARLLGVELDEAQGRALVGILNVPGTPEVATRPPFRGGQRGQRDGRTDARTDGRTDGRMEDRSGD